MILSLASKMGPCRHAGALMTLVLTVALCGCGDSAPTQSISTGKSPGKKLTDDQLYKYEGEGAAKKKVPISRQERLKLLHEAAKSSD